MKWKHVRVAVLAALLGCGVWGFWIEPASLHAEYIDLPLAWPYSRPLRVVAVSDLHVGAPYQTLDHLREVVERINALKPDLICLLGDYVTVGVLGGHRVDPRQIAPQLSRLHAPAGVMAVLGNHDRAFGGPEVIAALSGAGIRVLEDTAVRVSTPSGPIWVAGVSDMWSGKHDIQGALRPVSDNAPVLMITHNPDIFPDIPRRVLLTLAGHTHGGQVRLPLLGSPIVPSRYGQRYARGHIREGGRDLFVTTGIGTSTIPVRFGVPPIISTLTISQGSRAVGSAGSRSRNVEEIQ